MNQNYNILKVIIADDHELVREGLQVMISKITEIELIAEAANGEQLVRLTSHLLPDVVLTDVKMPVMDGIEATRQIRKKHPHIGVIALTSFNEENLIMDMLNAGANGYLLKNAGKKEITDAVKTVYKGESYYCKETNEQLSHLVAKGGVYTDKHNNLFTDREIQVIHLICEGLSSKLIASQMMLKTRTVERYRDSIMEKMEVKNSAAVVMYAVKHGLYKFSMDKK